MRASGRVGWVGCVGLVLAAAGCYWPVPGHDGDRSGHSPTEDAITAANVDRYVPATDRLIALDAATGATLLTATAPAFHQPVVAGGLVFLPGDFLGSPALAFPSDGCGGPTCSPIWESPSPATALTISNGRVYTTWTPSIAPSIAPFIASISAYTVAD